MSHITVKEKQELLRQLENGYKEMAEINLEIAEEGITADNESLKIREDDLTECDQS